MPSPSLTPTPSPALTRHDLLQRDLLDAIAARGNIKAYTAHTVLVREGEPTDSIYIILAGRVKAYATFKGREVVYGTMGANEYFGEMTLDGRPRSASVMTLEPTRCAVVPGPQVRDFMASHPDFAVHLVHKLIRMVRHSTEHVKSLATMDVYGRIAHLLLEKAQPEGGRQVVTEPLTQQDIADRVGCSREMVSRVFKQLTLGGYIALEGRRIVLQRKLPDGW